MLYFKLVLSRNGLYAIMAIINVIPTVDKGLIVVSSLRIPVFRRTGGRERRTIGDRVPGFIRTNEMDCGYLRTISFVGGGVSRREG